MRNLFREFLDLLPARPLQVGDVLEFNEAGLAIVELPGGGIVYARGEATPGQRVFVRDGVIETEAPTLIYVEGEA